ncbi:aminoglycoside phosphotransferase family protein [Paraburkholderia sediminicola]|uniref:phosphotransferase family protein n=1 Tax=Paraburkholderia sediminicola TaxID=458836 RepID=UPI0038B9A239
MGLELADDDVRALCESLRRMQLVRPGENPILTPLTGGVSSQIVCVDISGGQLCVKRALSRLRVAADWFAPLERNAAEVAWMKLASKLVPGCVPAILGEDGEARAFAMAYLDPNVFRVWKDDLLAGTADASVASAVGTILATIHGATAGDEAVARTFATDASFFALRLEPYFVASAAVNPDCSAALMRLVDITSRTKRALVHGDVSPKNILVGPAGPVFLDAECAWYGDPAFDVAFCLTHLLLKSVWRPDAAHQFLHCFDALRQAYFAVAVWERADELEARAAMLLPAILLARIDGKSPVEYVTQREDRERVRGFAKPFVIEAPKTLDAIRNRWTQEFA